MRCVQRALTLAAVAAAGTLTSAALAIPYASGVSQTGNTVDFFLNEDADTITITRDGGNQIVLNNVTKGAQSFDMTGFTTYEIEVTHSATAGWASPIDPTLNKISDDAVTNPLVTHDRPYAIEANKNPGSSLFGSFYVAQARPFTAADGRTLTDGIYHYNADFSRVDGGVANDPAADAGLDFSGSSFTSPWKLTIGPDDTVFISDWSDPTGGLKFASGDLSSGGLVLAEAGDANANSTGNHGSFASSAVTTGTLGTDLTVYAIDEDRTTAGNGQNSIWRWDVGSASSDSTVAPVLLFDSNTSPADTDGDPGYLPIGGVRADLDVDAENELLYVSQLRFDGIEGGLFVFDFNGNQLWNSKQFSIDNNLDGFTDDLLVPTSAGINDVFRNAQSIELSPDGTKLALHRRQANAENPITGAGSPYDGSVLIIDLDPVTGLPDLTVAGGAITGGLDAVFVADSNSDHTSTGLSWDLAGNLITGTNVSEVVEIFGPGGNSTATTRSDGTFTINGVTFGGGSPPVIPGDADCDGDVDLDDFNILAANFGQIGTVGKTVGDFDGDSDTDLDDFNILAANFGTGVPEDLGALPEPASLALLSLGAVAMLSRRRNA